MAQPYTAYFWDGPAEGRTEPVHDEIPKWDILVPVFEPIHVRYNEDIGDRVLSTRTAFYRRTYMSARLHRVIYEFAGWH